MTWVLPPENGIRWVWTGSSSRSGEHHALRNTEIKLEKIGWEAPESRWGDSPSVGGGPLLLGREKIEMDPNHGRLKEQACEQEVVKTSPLRDPIFFEVGS
mgnify:FL=1